MPAASCRTRPARSISLWLIASASAGSSRSGTGAFRTGPSDGSHLGLALGQELVDFLPHRRANLALRHFPDHFAALEDQSDPPSARHADVGDTRLPGAVHLASHHSNMDF